MNDERHSYRRWLTYVHYMQTTKYYSTKREGVHALDQKSFARNDHVLPHPPRTGHSSLKYWDDPIIGILGITPGLACALTHLSYVGMNTSRKGLFFATLVLRGFLDGADGAEHTERVCSSPRGLAGKWKFIRLSRG